MKKVYKLEDLDCPHCTAKIEKDISKAAQISSVSISLLAQKLTVEYNGDNISDLTKLVKKVVKKYEPDVQVVEL